MELVRLSPSAEESPTANLGAGGHLVGHVIFLFFILEATELLPAKGGFTLLFKCFSLFLHKQSFGLSLGRPAF